MHKHMHCTRTRTRTCTLHTQVSLKKQGASKEVAKRGKGDVIGEMTFLYP